MAVINNLQSDSTTDSLSAAMGKELNERLELVEMDMGDTLTNVSNLENRVNTLENSSSGESSQCSCETKIWTQPVA